MSFTAYKKEFKQKMIALEHYSVTIPHISLENNFRITLKSNRSPNKKVTSNGIIVDDTLTLRPLICHSAISRRDFLFMMDYWIGFAKLKQLAHIRLVPKFGSSGNIVKYWDDSSNLGYMQTSLSLGFKSLSNHESTISLEQSDILEVLTMRQTIADAFGLIQKEDLSFVEEIHRLSTSDSSFYQFAFKWRGVSNQFIFFYEEGHYYLTFNKEQISFTKNNVADLIHSLLQQMDEGLRIKNLIDPPHDILLAFLTKCCGPIFTLNPVTKEVMELLIQLGYTFEEVEAEAARLKEIKETTTKTKLASLPYKERTIQFFNKHYFSIILQSAEPKIFIISENIDDIVQFHADYFHNQLTKRFDEFK